MTPIELGLVELGERREVRIAGVRVAGRRRRPSGEKAALPRELGTSGRLWLLDGLAMVALWISLFAFPESTNWWTARDISILDGPMSRSALTSKFGAAPRSRDSAFLRVTAPPRSHCSEPGVLK